MKSTICQLLLRRQQFDEKENKYRASTGMLHTRERCEAMKNAMRNNEKPVAEAKPDLKPLEQIDLVEEGREDAVQPVRNQ